MHSSLSDHLQRALGEHGGPPDGVSFLEEEAARDPASPLLGIDPKELKAES